MAKVLIAVMKDKPLPSPNARPKNEEPPIPLEKRARYAIDCIEADMPSKERAKEFLLKIKPRLDNPELVSQIDKVLSDGT